MRNPDVAPTFRRGSFVIVSRFGAHRARMGLICRVVRTGAVLTLSWGGATFDVPADCCDPFGARS